MKRISVLALVILVVSACTVQARIHGYRYTPNRNRVRWSPYAGGLVSGDLYYSPYAFGPDNCGLVPGYVRYSPYAFGIGHSGLVAESATDYYGGLHAVRYDVRDCRTAPHHGGHRFQEGQYKEKPDVAFPQKISKATIETRRPGRTETALARRRTPRPESNEGRQLIAGYLKSRDIDFKTTRILSIEGTTVSIDFVLDDGETIIKYWNPEKVRSLAQSDGREKEFYDRYVKSWFSFCEDHLRAGGEIHQIMASDSGEILAMLSSCLDPSGAEKVYAAATTPGQ